MVELALLPNTESGLEGITDTSDVCNKYWYPEFAGWHGERDLKKLLRQTLPMALYRTWEIFVDHQALGSDCYLGITRLAEIAGRATRTGFSGIFGGWQCPYRGPSSSGNISPVAVPCITSGKTG